VGDLLDAGAEIGAEAVDVVAVLLRGGEEVRIGHHDRAGRVIGQRHVEESARRRVGRGRAFEHPLEQRAELEESELVGDPEGAAFGPEQGGEHQPLAVIIVMLACIIEKLGRHDARLDSKALPETPGERGEDAGALAERPRQGLGRLLDIAEIVALGLDMVAHPAFRSEGGPFRSKRTSLRRLPTLH
jgi:hypothetical protein